MKLYTETEGSGKNIHYKSGNYKKWHSIWQEIMELLLCKMGNYNNIIV